MKTVVASGNAGKIREIRAALEGAGIELVAQDEFGIKPAPEDCLTFVENSLAKARHAARSSGLPALADDSGICVRALGGAPGVRSARYSGADADDERNIDLLLKELEGVADRAAHYHASMTFVMHPDDPAPLIAEGIWRGRIIHERRGTGGFGYDPVFLDPELGLTGAQMDIDAKNQVSHRGKALSALARAIRTDGRSC